MPPPRTNQPASQGDEPMTEQMTGRKGAAGPDSPAGSPGNPASPAPAVPSPRDLAARSPHRDAARAADHSHQETPAAPAEHGPAEQAPAPPGPTSPGPAEPPRGHTAGPGRVRATGAQALVY